MSEHSVAAICLGVVAVAAMAAMAYVSVAAPPEEASVANGHVVAVVVAVITGLGVLVGHRRPAG